MLIFQCSVVYHNALLRPLLFLIMIADINEDVSESNLISFADDNNNNNIYLKSNIQCTYRYEGSGLYNNNIQLQ